MERKKKLIGRIAKGETVIVERMQEDLCDLWDAMEVAMELAKRANEADDEEKTDESSKDFMYKSRAAINANHNIWIAIHERYGFWKENIGVRDDYALVKIPGGRGGNKMSGFQFFKQISDIITKLEKRGDGLFGVEDA